MARCPVCRQEIEQRSVDQNARYWLLLHKASEQLLDGKCSAEAFHLYYKGKYIGKDDITMPTGEVTSIPRSSAFKGKDAVQRFNDYMTKVETELNERNVWLDD